MKRIAIRPLGAVLCLALASAAVAQEAKFRTAKPIWPAGREKEMNLSVGFRAPIETPKQGKTVLRIAAATIYRATVNGQFVGCGPARGPHGYFRVDEWDITGKLATCENVVAIEVAGYNSNSYYLLDQPSFLQAEVTCGDRVLASTAGDGAAFTAGTLDYRVQKVQRYSFQRPFVEVYRMAPGFDRWQREVAAPLAAVETAVQPEKELLPRGVLYSTFTVQKPTRGGLRGRVEKLDQVKDLWKDRSLTAVGPKLKGYPEGELAVIPTIEAQRLKSVPQSGAWRPWEGARSIALGDRAYEIVDLGVNRTGFLGAAIDCKKKTRLWLIFDEILSDQGDVDFRRMGCANIIEYAMEPGQYQVESIEPYTLRYLKLVCLEGDCTVGDIHLRECAHPEVPEAVFRSSDPRLDKLFAAGVETFRQNALDIFMDCPSRERAGWLCDSFFTSRVECDVAGAARIERNFFENFLLPARFGHIPDGMLPMCYPADHYDGVYIPNWALWFVVQLDEYCARSGDRATVEGLRPKVLKLFDFFKKYENSDGLLERLPSWVFVEWSAANQFTQDVNYPSNMLYAGALDAAGRMYGAADLAAKAERIRGTIRKQSFDGRFFVDNAVRREGKLAVTRNRTEVCQYFAFFFGVASPETHAELWVALRDRFGPDRAKKRLFPEIHAANSFVGNMLRMELLSRYGRNQQILDESIAYLLYMADRTGTLWENVGAYASCDHGFASHVVHTLYRDVLGLYQVDLVHRRIAVRFGDLKLERCQGRMPTPHGPIEIRWEHQGEHLVYRLSAPPGYQVKIDNQSRLELTREP
jgi:alpha-L-rhamnosidase